MAITQLEPHRIVLTDESVIVLDYDVTAGEPYRFVYYSRSLKKEHGKPLTQAKFDDLVRRQILPRGYHTSWKRTALTCKHLSQGLMEIAERIPGSFDAVAVENYIRGTGWGRELP